MGWDRTGWNEMGWDGTGWDERIGWHGMGFTVEKKLWVEAASLGRRVLGSEKMMAQSRVVAVRC